VAWSAGSAPKVVELTDGYGALGVLDALQRLQAPVVLVAVRLADAVLAVVGAEVVDVDGVLGVRLERVPEAGRERSSRRPE